MTEVTQLLEAIREGDASASRRLYEIIYGELRAIAERKMREERAGHTMQATALVHEAYLRLAGDAPETGWKNRKHFFFAAAETMRRILVDAARRRNRQKRGGAFERAALDVGDLADPSAPAGEGANDDLIDLIDLDDALRRFAAEAPEKSKLVELRYFAGLSLEEAAETLDISRATAARYWNYSRAWLYDCLTRGDPSKENSK